jgi:hypothetical protein
MTIEQTPLRPIRLDYRCDICKEGHYQHVNKALTLNPFTFPHECSNCGDTRVFHFIYPQIAYAEEGKLLTEEELNGN